MGVSVYLCVSIHSDTTKYIIHSPAQLVACKLYRFKRYVHVGAYSLEH